MKSLVNPIENPKNARDFDMKLAAPYKYAYGNLDENLGRSRVNPLAYHSLTFSDLEIFFSILPRTEKVFFY